MRVSEALVFLNGKLLPSSKAALSIYDFGIVLGATITDLLRTIAGRPYRMEEHIARFYRSCKYAGIAPPLSAEECARATCELIDANMKHVPPGGDLAVVYFITPGENLIYAGSAGGAAAGRPTFCIHSFPLPFALFRKLFEDGARLAIPSTRHVPPQCVDAKVKHRSRLHWWLAEREAKLVDSAAIPLLLDLDGNLTETGGANFLLARGGAVFSPSPRNILCGVSRSVVMEMCARLGIPFLERDLQVHDAVTCDEAFLVTTPYCIAPVVSINGIAVGPGPRGGPLFERLLSQWSEDAGLDIRGQFLA
jgi:branched-subunit amino acid aminotransferase/4-amino-4-deoxychorismate lyase